MSSDRVGMRIVDRSTNGPRSLLKLADGRTLEVRKHFPAGVNDVLRDDDNSIQIYLKGDDKWLDIGRPWSIEIDIKVPSLGKVAITFKEIETSEEMEAFLRLRNFHYRGGGGAGRVIPVIATSGQWDLPSVLGFIELSSSMIANSARKNFFNAPYKENSGVFWREWDRSTSIKFSSLFCRISRFVIHPEIRGLGLAKNFLSAAISYSASRWHYGGFAARFLEITADMLRYYRFLGTDFEYAGLTEGNQHRVIKDMTYLVRRALSDGGAGSMPQGGGGIMTLQRGYAYQLMQYLQKSGKPLAEVIDALKYDAAALDQETWEALYRINRRPKPYYVAGLTELAKEYVHRRALKLDVPSVSSEPPPPKSWSISALNVAVRSNIAQTSDARQVQDAFGFVGADFTQRVLEKLNLSFRSGDLNLICGASGAGKSVLLAAVNELFGGANLGAPATKLELTGTLAGPTAKVEHLRELLATATPLELRGRASLEDFLKVTARCGLAEPQLLVRPIATLSSGQRYRLRVALALLRHPDILLIDNFCESLDIYTAAAVTRGIALLAKEYGVAVLAATAAYDRLLSIGGFEQTILLRRGEEPVLIGQRSG